MGKRLAGWGLLVHIFLPIPVVSAAGGGRG
jgi:hypothetical protein